MGHRSRCSRCGRLRRPPPLCSEPESSAAAAALWPQDPPGPPRHSALATGGQRWWWPDPQRQLGARPSGGGACARPTTRGKKRRAGRDRAKADNAPLSALALARPALGPAALYITGIMQTWPSTKLSSGAGRKRNRAPVASTLRLPVRPLAGAPSKWPVSVLALRSRSSARPPPLRAEPTVSHPPGSRTLLRRVLDSGPQGPLLGGAQLAPRVSGTAACAPLRAHCQHPMTTRAGRGARTSFLSQLPLLR